MARRIKPALQRAQEKQIGEVLTEGGQYLRGLWARLNGGGGRRRRALPPELVQPPSSRKGVDKVWLWQWLWQWQWLKLWSLLQCIITVPSANSLPCGIRCETPPSFTPPPLPPPILPPGLPCLDHCYFRACLSVCLPTCINLASPCFVPHLSPVACWRARPAA